MSSQRESIAVISSRPRFMPALKDLIAYLEAANLNVYVLDWEFPEFNHKESLSVLASEAARHCSLGIFQPVIVTATGLFIEALNEFPGLHTGYIMKRIGNKGILKLLEGESNRNALWKFILAYCEPTKDPLLFEGITVGKISTAERGFDGYVFDFIFIPEDNNNKMTFSENIVLKKQVGSRWRACQKFLSWYKQHQAEEAEKQ
ncbi:MAG: non-canonical purine NTP pyrophosphatase [Candidatus Portnoybacteria bacterium CG23_combo_of_CG06-09_8_20_14_all_37_13]|uniref:Non-canonical purine NTP pyrophosphatase n=1 Tax=Candidatus Portnoybacteria bacterium CG23_combo_of_CG06-09_8_20_14_all_37_13 TaxID=1974819 RepID=A0A2G9YDW5_9BACT|nr:MAG: non-canonical purine NTP pyrophosphatase [Candidatus Portnoybacteria bacterium CG23_combo_of_CG06-09_8_20_14_all_37_13]